MGVAKVGSYRLQREWRKTTECLSCLGCDVVIRRSAKNSNKRSGYSDFVYATENQ